MNNKDESSLYQRTKQIFKEFIKDSIINYKDSIINYIGKYPKEHYSFKYIWRYIQSGKASQEVLETINKHLQEKKFESIIDLLAKLDWPHAEQYFKDNPQEMYCGHKQGSIFSYIKFENEIYRRDVFIGAGAFGKVKTAKSKAGEEIIIKRQTLGQDDNFDKKHDDTIQEGAVNEDLGLAKSKILQRTYPIKKNKTVHKFYQGLINRGQPLNVYLNQTSIVILPAERFDYAIQLLLEVSQLHTGKASKTGKSYAHRDIKPANVCRDEQGKIHLIDFGMAISGDLTQSHKANCGTKLYQPFDLGYDDHVYGRVVTTPSYFFDDKIACLRTIFHPKRDLDSLLSLLEYKKLPDSIKTLLETKRIRTCLSQDYDLKNIAAVLIFYRFNPKCTEEDVQKILKDNHLADRIVEIYSTMTSTAEQKTKWLNLSNDNICYLSDILSSDFLKNMDMIFELNKIQIRSFDELTSFLSKYRLLPEAFSPYISNLSLDNVQSIITSMPKCSEVGNLHQAIENLKAQGQQLLDREYPQAARAIWAVYIQLRQQSPLTEEYINKITAPHQEILQAHRGSYEKINVIKDLIRKLVFNLTHIPQQNHE